MAEREANDSHETKEETRQTPERITTGASATHSNVGPKHRGAPDTEALDALEGTTSNRQQSPDQGKVKRKPNLGDKENADTTP